MTHWDRIQSMQLELAQKDAQVRRLIDDLESEVSVIVQQRQNVEALSQEVEDLRRHLHEALESRDLARNVAVRLEQELNARRGINPFRCAICDGDISLVPLIGEAT